MIFVGTTLWATVLDGFTSQPGNDERVCYLDGFTLTNGAVATTVTFPDAETSPGHYTVTAEAMSRAGRHFRTYGMQRLAQIHTHGGSHVDHSHRDSELAYSQLPGAISIVLPHHGRTRPHHTSPAVGVHLRADDGWHRIPPADVSQLITTVPTIIDQRNSAWTSETSPTGTSDPHPAPVRKLLATLLKWLS